MSSMIPALLGRAKATGRLASILRGASMQRDGVVATSSPALLFSMPTTVIGSHHFSTQTTDESHPPPPDLPPSKRGGALDEDKILASASRLFSKNLQNPSSSSASSSSSSPATESEEVSIPAEIKEEHKQRVAALQRRRKKFPLEQPDSLEVWLEKHKEDLMPFRNFLKKHDVDEQRTIAFLHRIGYWGHRTMLHKLPPESGGYVHEQVFEEWSTALASEQVPFPAEELIKQWPGMLARPASNLPSTFAILKAAIPDEDDLKFVLGKVPKALGHTPLSLQNRLLKLQLATAGELKDLLVTNPRLLELKLEDILSNVRLLRQNSRSLVIFKQLLEHRPDLMTWRPNDLERRLQGAFSALQNVLPQGLRSEEVIKAKPVLFLLKPGMLTDRWTFIQEATQLLPQWADELETVVAHAAAMPIGGGNVLTDTARGVSSGEQHHHGEPGLVPESPQDLGVKANSDNKEFVFDSESEQESESLFSEEQRAGRKAYSAISEMLWTRDRRLQRLRYLAEELPEEAASMSFLSVLLVSLERFQRRFPQFWRWRRDHGLVEVRQEAAVHHHDEYEMHG